MRLYSFCNVYLSSIQQGIQTAHLTHEMFVTQPTRFRLDVMTEWATDHKTIIVLNGGAAQDIKDIAAQLTVLSSSVNFVMPVGRFHEDEYSLDGTMTCTGAIIPSIIYNALNQRAALQKLEELSTGVPMSNDTAYFAAEDARDDYFYFADDEADRLGDEVEVTRFRKNTPEWELITLIRSCRLAG